MKYLEIIVNFILAVLWFACTAILLSLFFIDPKVWWAGSFGVLFSLFMFVQQVKWTAQDWERLHEN